MSYLESLVRILPRQRRAYATQRQVGQAILLLGFALACLYAVLATKSPAAWSTPLGVLAAFTTGSMIFWGAYRYTRADMLLHENAALILAVSDAIEAGDMERGVSAAALDEVLDIAERVDRFGGSRG